MRELKDHEVAGVSGGSIYTDAHRTQFRGMVVGAVSGALRGGVAGFAIGLIAGAINGMPAQTMAK